ncbi:MAG: hypothetical protein DI626_12120 [Micavibrio aeruginosavorus]|uniref:Uncharacterized protein n=1 Tax=Micavibrio aeruginosavorus TaxID=349221 RepID=A0A2W4Z731_9BACT|nr:MAG: hypothetical protein DI626_12120 [Micavibrio aeruginosavorus]
MLDDTDKPRLSFAEAAAAVHDLRAAREAQKFIPTADFQDKVKEVVEKFDADTFRRLCRTAIKDGLTSVQSLEEKFPGAIPRNADKNEKSWKLPSPANQRAILAYFSSLDKPSGEREQWRHEAKQRERVARIYER